MPQGYAQTFASIEGTLVISTESRDDLQKIVADLISRPELELTSSVIYGRDAVSLNLRYNAHGAWPADFRHKVGSAANRSGVDNEVEVSLPTVARFENPSSCPKLLSGQECYACERGMELEEKGLPVPSQFRIPKPQVQDDELFTLQGERTEGHFKVATLVSESTGKETQVVFV